jgi:hypothetical protein
MSSQPATTSPSLAAKARVAGLVLVVAVVLRPQDSKHNAESGHSHASEQQLSKRPSFNCSLIDDSLGMLLSTASTQ